MDYKINKESVKKYGGYKALTEEDALGEATKRLEDFIFEAWREAIKEGIRANTVLINKHFAKVNGFPFAFMGRSGSLPPMICGLEVHVTEELPDGYDFAVLEAPETEREKLIRQTRADTVKKMQERAAEIVGELVELVFDDNMPNCIVPSCHKPDSIGCGHRICIDENKAIWLDKINQIAKEMLEGSNEVQE